MTTLYVSAEHRNQIEELKRSGHIKSKEVEDLMIPIDNCSIECLRDTARILEMIIHVVTDGSHVLIITSINALYTIWCIAMMVGDTGSVMYIRPNQSGIDYCCKIEPDIIFGRIKYVVQKDVTGYPVGQKYDLIVGRFPLPVPDHVMDRLTNNGILMLKETKTWLIKTAGKHRFDGARIIIGNTCLHYTREIDPNLLEVLKQSHELEIQTEKRRVSAVVKPTPAVVKPTPAVVKPAPAVVKPAPAVVKPTPAVVKPAPAVVKPTPAASVTGISKELRQTQVNYKVADQRKPILAARVPPLQTAPVWPTTSFAASAPRALPPQTAPVWRTTSFAAPTPRALPPQTAPVWPTTPFAVRTKPVTPALQCPVCNKHLTPPTGTCFNGHTVCSTCKRFIVRCPTCNTDRINSSNLILDNMLQSMRL